MSQSHHWLLLRSQSMTAAPWPFREVTFGADIQNMELQPETASRCLHALCCLFGYSWISRVNEERENLCGGNQLVQQLQPFRRDLNGQLGYAGDIAARTVKAGDEAS